MKDPKDENLLSRLKEVFESVMPDIGSTDLPKESLPLGTVVRSIKYDKLGIITDSFYGDVDKDGKKIIIYTVLMFPEKRSFTMSKTNSEQFYISNEYEYDIIAYLMMPPVNLEDFNRSFGGNYLL